MAATAQVQLLAVNDFHGNLEAPSGSSGLVNTTTAGGAEYLATHLKQDVAQKPNSLVVAASVGNHEFDEGWQELQRMQKGAATRRSARTATASPARTSSTSRRTC